MSEEVKISSVKLSDGNVYAFFDKEGIHCTIVGNRGLVWITGDPVVDSKILTDGLYITEHNGQSITNLLTYDEQDGKVKTRKVEFIYKDIGGKENQVSNDGVFTLGTPKVKSPNNE